MTPNIDLRDLAPEAGISLPRYQHTPAEEENELTKRMRANYPPGVPAQVQISDRLLIDVLEETAQHYPDNIVTDFLGGALTYSQLLERVRKAAALLTAAGVTPGDRVSVIGPNCPQYPVILFACWQIGAVAALHNPLSPAKQIQAQLERCQPKVIICWQKSIASLPEDYSGTVYSLDITKGLPTAMRLALKLPVKQARKLRNQMCAPVPRRMRDFDDAISHYAPLTQVTRIDPDLPAALLHTGGTTGKPKSVILTNRNLVVNAECNCAWVVNLHEGKEVFYDILPFFHAFGMELTLVAMVMMAGTAVIFPKFDTEMVLKAQQRRPGTFMLGVPPIFDRLTKAAVKKGVDMTSFKYSICGAMPMAAEVAAAWEEMTEGLVVEGYGMTETSPTILGSPFSPERRPGFLGLVFPSMQVRIVDQDNPTVDVPDGEIGELVAKGPCCSPGYWQDPEETEMLFTEEGWLRTGDLVRLEDGMIKMADRRKEMIISGGFNIYPSQVEGAIRTMPGIRDVAVVGVPDHSDAARGEEVRAVVVLEDENTKIDLGQIRAWAEQSLAHYALPRSLTIIKELPYSQLGKVMRRKVLEQILGKPGDD